MNPTKDIEERIRAVKLLDQAPKSIQDDSSLMEKWLVKQGISPKNAGAIFVEDYYEKCAIDESEE